MLAIVCNTYEGVKALEAYDREGLINKSCGLHAVGASIGRPLDDPFLVICLEHLRYVLYKRWLFCGLISLYFPFENYLCFNLTVVDVCLDHMQGSI